MKALPIVMLLLTLACRTMTPEMTSRSNISLDALAERYVKLTLQIGQHGSDYVDAFYGPAAWREEAKANVVALPELALRAETLSRDLAAVTIPPEEMVVLRHSYLTKQVIAMRAKLAMLSGTRYSFDEESKLLYDAVARSHPESHYRSLLNQLEGELPGDGAIAQRLETFRQSYVISPEKLDHVFRTAVEGCRSRTLQHLELPESEAFTIEYVTGKSWSGYNWYQGNYKSLIQVNTDLPIFIDRAIDLACHEGYPGHHVYNLLLEKNLARGRGWIEFTVYPLFSPQSLIAEGSANYGIEIAFAADERLQYEKNVLFPAAGLDPATAGKYYRVQALASKLSYAGNEAARRYLNGEITADAAVDWLTRYALFSPQRARQRLKFIEQYRSYVINYNLGKDLVARHIEAVAGSDPKKRWDEFEKLLSRPTLPGNLSGGTSLP